MVAGKPSLFVDTSGWIEVFGKNNPFHKKARSILDRAVREGRPIITTNYVMVEFIGNAEKKCRLTRERLLEAVDGIMNWPSIKVVHIGEESHAQAITLLRGRRDKGWSLVDATSFIVMEQLKIREALAHDRHFGQATYIQLL